jgi:small-conductance mechanosensitive channel
MSGKGFNLTISQLSAPLAGIALYEWIVAGAVMLVTVVALHGAQVLLRRHLARLAAAGRGDTLLAELLGATVARTGTLALLVIAVLAGVSTLDLAAPWDSRAQNLCLIAVGLQITRYLNSAITIGTRRYFQQHAADGAAPSTVANTLVGWAIKTVLWTLFALTVLSNLGINITTFIASLGIGGIAIALAAQNILGDLFASLSIAVDKPFEVGDAISANGASGTVEHVGLKTTRLRADSGEQIVISNTDLLKNVVRNYKRMSTRRVQLSFRVDPATPADLAGAIPAAIRDIVEHQADVRFDRVHLKSVTQEALEFELVFFVLTPSYATYMDVQQTVLLQAMALFDRLGVSTGAPATRLLLERAAAQRPPTDGKLAAQPAPTRLLKVP